MNRKVGKDEIQHLKIMTKNDKPSVQHSIQRATTESNQTLTRTEEIPFMMPYILNVKILLKFIMNP